MAYPQALLASHRSWVSKEKFNDPFAGPLRISALREKPQPAASSTAAAAAAAGGMAAAAVEGAPEARLPGEGRRGVTTTMAVVAVVACRVWLRLRLAATEVALRVLCVRCAVLLRLSLWYGMVWYMLHLAGVTPIRAVGPKGYIIAGLKQGLRCDEAHRAVSP